MTKRTSVMVVSFFTPLVLTVSILMIFVEEKSTYKNILPLIGQLSFLGLVWLNHFRILRQNKNINHNNRIHTDRAPTRR